LEEARENGLFFMSIEIICLGKTKQKFIEDGITEYMKRLQSFSKVSFTVLPDIKLSGSNTIELVKKKEAEVIKKKLKPDSFLIVLDEIGKQMSSVKFASLIERTLLHKKIQIVIGGVYGLDDEIRKKANLLMGLSQMTFTHRMVRMILVEQIYRAFTILNNKQYHY
jgi:23S rRNA (pseudouridine1915-N3)-methyltransferase